MADRPIIFSAPMVQALLAGRKTQTRRIFKLPTHTSGRNSHRIYEHPKMGGWEPTTSGGGGCFTIARDGSKVPAPERVAIWHRTCGECIEAPYQPGDRLWVREAWRTEADCYDDLAPSDMSGEETILYEADADWQQNKTTGRRRASMHMPRWASRLTLYVSEVRVQRLQDISEEDARAEGAVFHDGRGIGHSGWRHDDRDVHANARSSFARLWNDLHGAGSWAANPWIVALTFAVHHGNIESAPLSLYADKAHPR